MATYSAALVKTATTTAATVDTVTLTSTNQYLRITNLSTSTDPGDRLYVRTDGTAPTVAGDDCFVVPPGGSRRMRAGDVVKLIATNAVAYSVEED